jgi:predicted amidohydrolase YtcJ
VPLLKRTMLPTSPTKLCETILFNGKIITADKDFSIAEATAIGQGIFTRVGTNSEILALADEETRKMDLKGRTVVPGFIDTHPHLINAGIRRAIYLPLAGLHSIESIKRRIGRKVKNIPCGEWIITSPIGEEPDHFDLPDRLDEKRWPTRWDLDEVSGQNPVYIPTPVAWPHPAILNSYALRLLGVKKKSAPEQHGVRIVRDPERGEPNGQFHGLHLFNGSSPLYKKLQRLLPKNPLNAILEGIRASMRDYNAAGVTAGYEGHNTSATHLLYCKELWSRKELKVRLHFAYEVDVTRSIAEIENWMKDLVHATGSGFGDDWLKIGGVTVSIDGGPTQFGDAIMNRPYLNAYAERAKGVQKVSTRKLKQIVLLAARNNLRMNLQVGGDKAADIALKVYEDVNREFPIGDRRWVLQHIQHPSYENIRKCAELGVVITTNSNFEYSKGAETYVKGLRGDYCSRAIPLRKWLDAGVQVAQGTDGAHYQPMFTLWNSLKRIDGRTGESLMTSDKEITREEALRLCTINGARILFREDRLGSIEEGKLADLAVLDNDILTCPIDEIRDTKVLMTMVGGEMVYEGN